MANNTTTLKDNAFTDEYAVFNYIMVAASCGVLLIVMIIARVFCFCNKNPDYEKVNFDPERTLSNDFIIQTERVKPSTEFMENPQMPGEVYEDELERTFIKKDNPVHQISQYDYPIEDQYHRGIWHTASTNNIDTTVRIFQ